MFALRSLHCGWIVISQGLVTNLPKEVMAYAGYPFSSSIPESFVKWSEVRDYLKNCGEEITPFVEFGASVEVS